MKLIEQINADIITAYKARNTEAKTILSVLKGAVTKVNKIPEDVEVVASVKTMIKTHNNSMVEHNAPTLTDGEQTTLEGYLPSQMSEGDIESVVEKYLADNEVNSMGQIMGHLKSNFGGQYDGKLASTVVKSFL
jgi:hypothetical protein